MYVMYINKTDKNRKIGKKNVSTKNQHLKVHTSKKKSEKDSENLYISRLFMLEGDKTKQG